MTKIWDSKTQTAYEATYVQDKVRPLAWAAPHSFLNPTVALAYGGDPADMDLAGTRR